MVPLYQPLKLLRCPSVLPTLAGLTGCGLRPHPVTNTKHSRLGLPPFLSVTGERPLKPPCGRPLSVRFGVSQCWAVPKPLIQIHSGISCQKLFQQSAAPLYPCAAPPSLRWYGLAAIHPGAQLAMSFFLRGMPCQLGRCPKPRILNAFSLRFKPFSVSQHGYSSVKHPCCIGGSYPPTPPRINSGGMVRAGGALPVRPLALALALALAGLLLCFAV